MNFNILTNLSADETIGEEAWDLFIKIITSKEFYVPVITICITYLITKAVSRLVKRFINSNAKEINDKKRNTIFVLINSIVKYCLIILACIIILGSWGVNVTGFITGLGIAGVVGGLALQDALKDIIMGCNIILDNYFVVGDYVTINGFTGEVVEFGLKDTKIRDVNGVTLVISNREITNVINYSLKSFNLPINIDVAYEEDHEKVLKILDKVIEELIAENKYVKKGSSAGINGLDESSIKYLLNITCNPKEQFLAKRQVLLKVKESFDKNKVKIPYKQIEVHNGKGI